ncbi:membrane-bound ATP synthase F0 sector, subunit a [Acinetobacter baumannii ATCC 17978]|nr:membrane-bound ATP synthase F0 sector, subunit a [Acinetobacter baumannii ATCC 17978]
MIISIADWNFVGTPAFAALATIQNNKQKITPRPIDQPIESK